MFLVALALAQDVNIRDSLASGSSATAVYGGSFTGSGWRIDDSNSRQYWDFGAQLARGQVSVVIDEVSLGNLTGDNNHMIELFDEGGHWDSNRAINLRVYGSDNSADHGQAKLKCWDETQGAEDRAAMFDWDGAAHTFTIAWGEGYCALYRDGSELLYLEAPGMDMRVGTLWLPLNNWEAGYSAPIGALYSDLQLVGWTGEEPADDGTVVDDGDPSTLVPIEDVTAAAWEPDSVFSDSEDLTIEIEGSDVMSVAYLSFDLSAFSGTVQSAQLQVTARDVTSADGDGGHVYAVADTSWSEDSLTWNGRPALGAYLGSFGPLTQARVATIDVTAGTVAGGRVAFAILAAGANATHLSSKEDGDGSQSPLLGVEVSAEEPADDTTGGDEEPAGDDAPGDAGGRDTASTTPRDGAPGDAEVIGAMGCGCNTPAPVPAQLGLALALLVAVRRR